MDALATYLDVSPVILKKAGLSLLILAVLFSLRKILLSLITRKLKDPKNIYYSRRVIGYSHGFLLIILLSSVWIKGFGSIGTYIGLTSAGLAIALHETLANIAGWFFIISKKPFVIGDRVQIGDTKGDVIDIRVFQFTLAEVGNWVDAEQSTGRVVHIPNSQVIKEKTANYHSGFRYIWNEIPVLVTFESDWRKTRKILEDIAKEKIEHCSSSAEREIHRAASQYMVYFNKLTPAVYLSAKDSGVLFTIRYIVDPRQRRGTEQILWEAILEEFEKTPGHRPGVPHHALLCHGPPRRRRVARFLTRLFPADILVILLFYLD